nr:hypothetical protein [Tanacetum cinerariifolium]
GRGNEQLGFFALAHEGDALVPTRDNFARAHHEVKGGIALLG